MQSLRVTGLTLALAVVGSAVLAGGIPRISHDEAPDEPDPSRGGTLVSRIALAAVCDRLIGTGARNDFGPLRATWARSDKVPGFARAPDGLIRPQGMAVAP
ncbi:MAG TPA: hypothetical protein VND19_06510 [Acetobacteraceae bacterium]|nr:hypothetical protein [Acetobacteraceae bacterium]